MKNSETKAEGRRPATWQRVIFEVSFFAYGAAGISTAFIWPDHVPWLSLVGLIAGLVTIARAWWETRGTALRPAVVWSAVAIGLAGVSQIVAIDEPYASGRPWAGHLVYLASLATLAAGVSVFGARTPGCGAWAILTGLLVFVFLIPWLEGSGLRGGSGLELLRLDAPWSIFYATLALAVVTNYLPTRFGASALLLGCWLLTEFASLDPSRSADWRGWMWSVGPTILALSVMRAGIDGAFRPRASPGLPRLWLWFRDAWGVVWALRVRERFNRAAEVSKWPIRLGWQGVESIGGGDEANAHASAEATFSGLIRRFATPKRVAEVACPPNPLPGQ